MPVEVLARPVVAHSGARVGVTAAIWTSRRSTPASSIVVTKVCRSICGCIYGNRTPGHLGTPHAARLGLCGR